MHRGFFGKSCLRKPIQILDVAARVRVLQSPPYCETLRFLLQARIVSTRPSSFNDKYAHNRRAPKRSVGRSGVSVKLCAFFLPRSVSLSSFHYHHCVTIDVMSAFHMCFHMPITFASPFRNSLTLCVSTIWCSPIKAVRFIARSAGPMMNKGSPPHSSG